MGRIVQLQQQQSSLPPPGVTLQELIRDVLRKARRRTGLDEGTFADRVNLYMAENACPRRRQPGLGPTAIKAYELGDALPVVDVYFAMIHLAGFPVEDALRRFLSSDGDAATSA